MHDRTNPSPLQVMPPATEHGPVRDCEQDQAQIPPALTPWATRDQDPDQAVAELSNLFPNATIWFGDFTGSYWALLRGEDGTARLIEGVTPNDLIRRLDPTKPRTRGNHEPPPRPPAGVHWHTTTPCPTPTGHPSPSRRTARGRCRARRSFPRTWSRNGRC